MVQRQTRDLNDMVCLLAAQKHFLLREQMCDVKSLGFESFVYGIARIPKSQIIGQSLDLVVRNDRVHVLRRGSRWRGILETEPNRAPTVKDERNLVIKSFVKREK
jgi:hypothetical protein